MREKNITRAGGIYQITNVATGDSYIGSSKYIKQRWGSHKHRAFTEEVQNNQMYKDMRSTGLDNFNFEMLEQITDVENTLLLLEREEYYCKLLKPTYNKTLDGKGGGIRIPILQFDLEMNLIDEFTHAADEQDLMQEVLLEYALAIQKQNTLY